MDYTKLDISDIMEVKVSALEKEFSDREITINNNIKLKMSINTKRYLISSLTTFLTGVAVVLLSQWDSITLASISDGSVMGLLFVAVRAGVKAVIEYLLSLK